MIRNYSTQVTVATSIVALQTTEKMLRTMSCGDGSISPPSAQDVKSINVCSWEAKRLSKWMSLVLTLDKVGGSVLGLQTISDKTAPVSVTA